MRSPVPQALFPVILFSILFFPGGVFADTLSISPAAGIYSKGQTFSVRITVTSGQAVNAVSAALTFPTDKLQVASVSKIGSILNLWVEEPSFSNTNGTVSLEGVVPNPGFAGSNGSVLTINFRAVGDGVANLRFASGSLLANDGYGTNILRNRGTASYTINPASPAPEPVEEAPAPSFIDLNEEPKRATPSDSKTISVEIPPAKTVFDSLVKFLSVVIPLVALVFFLLHTTKKGVSNLRTLRKDIHNIDRLVEKSFDIIKEDMADSIRMLERAGGKRKLTHEEDAIIRRLRQNLADAERIIHKEVLKAEKDIGD